MYLPKLVIQIILLVLMFMAGVGLGAAVGAYDSNAMQQERCGGTQP